MPCQEGRIRKVNLLWMTNRNNEGNWKKKTINKIQKLTKVRNLSISKAEIVGKDVISKAGKFGEGRAQFQF